MAAPIKYNDPYYDTLDQKVEAKVGLPPGLLSAIRLHGERTNADRVSSAGAKSVYQIIPSTRDAVLKKYGVDAYISNENAAHAAALLLKESQDRNGGDPSLAVAEYHGGTNKSNWGPITKSYVKRVMGALNPISEANAAEMIDQATLDDFNAWQEKQKELSSEIAAMPESDIPEDQQEMIDQETLDDFEEWQKAQKEQPTQTQEMPLSTALSNAVVNAPQSFYKMGSGLVDAVMNPLDTASGMAHLAHGVAQSAVPDELIDLIVKTGIIPDDRPKAEALANDYIKAYGGWDNIKRTLSEDPARVLSDISMLAGGAGMASKSSGMARTADVLNKVSVATDPLQMLSKAGRAAGPAIVDTIGNIGTHTGGESIVKAFQAGLQGGTKSKAFIDAMTNEANIADVVPVLKEALNNMRTERMTDYVTEMASLNGNPAILNLNNIESVAKAATLGKYKDYVFNKKSSGIQKEILKEIEVFKKLPASEYHTIEGVDKLKRAIGDIRDSTAYGTPERVVADRAYNAIKKEIVKQDPKYGDIMKSYETASEKIKEVEKTFSLGDKASQDSAIRKLQSVLRNNANTNYGNRGALMESLEKYGAGDVPSSLAGQSMNTWTPRGLGAPVMAGNIGYGIANPTALLAVPFQSPKLVGKVTHGIGAAARPAVEAYKQTPAEIKALIEEAAKRRNNSLPRMGYQAASRQDKE
jgi:hypothetical protein